MPGVGVGACEGGTVGGNIGLYTRRFGGEHHRVSATDLCVVVVGVGASGHGGGHISGAERRASVERGTVNGDGSTAVAAAESQVDHFGLGVDAVGNHHTAGQRWVGCCRESEAASGQVGHIGGRGCRGQRDRAATVVGDGPVAKAGAGSGKCSSHADCIFGAGQVNVDTIEGQRLGTGTGREGDVGMFILRGRARIAGDGVVNLAP